MPSYFPHFFPTKVSLMRVLFLTLLLFVSEPSSHSFAQKGQATRKDKVKVAFIYNFAKFTTWPDRSLESLPPGSFPICLVGSEPLGSLLDKLTGKKIVNDRTILIRKKPSQDVLKSCRILYISASESAQLDNLLKTLNGHPVLTIGNTEGYAKRGVGINLIEKNEKLGFEINRKAILKSGLILSSELLALGVLVDTED